uniref:TatD family deoxyribonuclease n=1 Tax=candidate division CPR3 bacterium TaxID=2268181 RepID=A0A7C4R849_UNCC3
MLVDTHAHLNFSDYNDLDQVIKRSLDVGVKKMVCVSSNITDSIEAIEVARRYPGIVFAAVGIHPQCTDPENRDSIDNQISQLEELVLKNKDMVVAIGECGLDYTEVIDGERKRSPEEQRKIFLSQIELASKYDLPILIHCNKAQEELYGILRSYKLQAKKLTGIFHFYSGGKKRLKKFLEFEGFMFGVDGPVTYDEGLQQVVKEIPLERIVLETDCPYLAPEPYRGERNEPSYIPLIAKKVAEVKGVSLEELENKTEENVKKIFSI